MEQEISHTRERIGRTVSELEQRLSPGQLMDQALGYARDHGGQLASSVAGAVGRNPLPVIVTGLGVMWMLKSYGSGGRSAGGGRLHDGGGRRRSSTSSWGDEYGEYRGSYDVDTDADTDADTGHGLRETLSGMGETIKSKVADARDSMSSATSSMGDRVHAAGGSLSDRVHSAQGSLGGRVHGVVDGARSAKRAIGERWDFASQAARDQARRARGELGALMDEQPLLMGAIGLAVGATVAALMPGTRREHDLMGEASQSFTDKAGEVAAEGYESLRESASQSVDELARSIAGEETDREAAGEPPSGSPPSVSLPGSDR